jgi:hypothetical protein
LAVLGFELRPLHSNARTWEGEAGGTWVQGQPGLYSKTLVPKKRMCE